MATDAPVHLKGDAVFVPVHSESPSRSVPTASCDERGLPGIQGSWVHS